MMQQQRDSNISLDKRKILGQQHYINKIRLEALDRETFRFILSRSDGDS